MSAEKGAFPPNNIFLPVQKHCTRNLIIMTKRYSAANFNERSLFFFCDLHNDNFRKSYSMQISCFIFNTSRLATQHK